MMAETYQNHFNVDCRRNTGSNTGKIEQVIFIIGADSPIHNDHFIKEFYSENS